MLLIFEKRINVVFFQRLLIPREIRKFDCAQL